jgi:hypothetical protein
MKAHTVFAHQSYQRTIVAPHHVFDGRRVDFREGLLLLDVIQNNGRRRAEDEASSSSVEYLIHLTWGIDGFNDRVRQIPDLDDLQM